MGSMLEELLGATGSGLQSLRDPEPSQVTEARVPTRPQAGARAGGSRGQEPSGRQSRQGQFFGHLGGFIRGLAPPPLPRVSSRPVGYSLNMNMLNFRRPSWGARIGYLRPHVGPTWGSCGIATYANKTPSVLGPWSSVGGSVMPVCLMSELLNGSAVMHVCRISPPAYLSSSAFPASSAILISNCKGSPAMHHTP